MDEKISSIQDTLATWKQSLVTQIPIGGLHTRNPIAYKWKAPFRAWLLREGTFWRTQDLLSQSLDLHRQGNELGARILLRSGFESVATLIFLNQSLKQVLDGVLNFQTFGERTSKMLLGSKNNKSGPETINIISVLEKCEKKYPGILTLYGQLSESAHPSYESLCVGYSQIDFDEDEVNFSNRWYTFFGESHVNLMELCMSTFHQEYDVVWPELILQLESWIVTNDSNLEATKGSD